MACFKLGIRFGRRDMVKRFQRSGRTGFYLAVLQEGDVGPGDSLEFIARDTHGITVADIANLFMADATNQDLLRRKRSARTSGRLAGLLPRATLGTGRLIEERQEGETHERKPRKSQTAGPRSTER